MKNSYKTHFRTKRFRYDEDRDTLQRGISVMVELLKLVVWLLVIIAAVVSAGLLGISFYLLAQ